MAGPVGFDVVEGTRERLELADAVHERRFEAKRTPGSARKDID